MIFFNFSTMVGTKLCPHYDSFHEISKKKILLTFITPLLFAGCAAIKNNVPFPEPKDGDRARIRVVIPSVFNNYRGVVGYPNSQCMSRKTSGGHVVDSSFGFEKNLNGQKIGMPTTPFSEKKGYITTEAYLPANQPVIFTFLMPGDASAISTGTMNYTTYYKGCIAKVGFTPKTNADYELIFPSNGSCQFALNRLIADKGVVSAEPVSTNDVENCH
jgi:hypothetical protein